VNKNVHEILLITQEECAEVTQAISKIFRFGFSSKHPVTGESNLTRLEDEVVDLLLGEQVIDGQRVMEAKVRKSKKLNTWSNIKTEVKQDE
jgi:NTP pyrophosphatase (non-canonical NTP hydrolase)